MRRRQELEAEAPDASESAKKESLSTRAKRLYVYTGAEWRRHREKKKGKKDGKQMNSCWSFCYSLFLATCCRYRETKESVQEAKEKARKVQNFLGKQADRMEKVIHEEKRTRRSKWKRRRGDKKKQEEVGGLDESHLRRDTELVLFFFQSFLLSFFFFACGKR
jgi:hypothetical protein